MEESPRNSSQAYRSAASMNWRVKDDSPRAAHTQPQKFQQRGSAEQRQHTSSPGAAPAESTNPGTRLYVGNLLYSAQSQDVEQLFLDNGFKIAQINMSTDPFTGRNPSYCFVDLDSADEASKAMSELNGKEVLGRPVKINPGVAKRSMGSGGSPSPRVKTYERGWAKEGSGQNPGNENYKPTFDRWSRNDASTHWNSPSEQGRRVYVGGLPRIEPQSAVDSEMQKLFEGFELQAVSKIISPHPSKATEPGNHYYLFVDLESSDAVDTAIEKLNASESPWGGELRVSKARDNRDRKVNREQQAGGQSRPSVGSGRWGGSQEQT